MVQVFNRYKFSGRSLGFGLLILDFKLSVSQKISSFVVVQLDFGCSVSLDLDTWFFQDLGLWFFRIWTVLDFLDFLDLGFSLDLDDSIRSTDNTKVYQMQALNKSTIAESQRFMNYCRFRSSTIASMVELAYLSTD